MRSRNGKMQNANCKLQIGIACVFALAAHAAALAAPFSFDEIEFWVGDGASRSALVIDWVENAAEPPALAWGYRWDDAAKGRDMLRAIVAADPRLFARLGGGQAEPTIVYGLGYDANDDAVFEIDDPTVTFDSQGVAFSGPADLSEAVDPGDLYAEGWFTGFWHYGMESPLGANPYDGGNFVDAPKGMAGRNLADGSWDSWVYSPSFNFAAFAANPHAAPSPYPPGDFNRDGEVDAADYNIWRAAFGSTSQLAADANRNGVVDAADYVIWREQYANEPATTDATASIVPEPLSAIQILIYLTIVSTATRFRNWPQIAQMITDVQ